jgi:signal transduction histidine kinase/DNA-binding NarL/FixJ family response regulator
MTWARLKNLSFTKLVLVVAALQVASLGSLIYYNHQQSLEFYQEKINQDLERLRIWLNLLLARPLFERDRAGVQFLLQQMHSDSQRMLDYLIVYDASQRVFAELNLIDSHLPQLDSSLQSAMSDAMYDAALPLVFNGQPVGSLRVGRSIQSFIDTRERSLRQNLLIGAAWISATLLALGLAIRLLSRKLKLLLNGSTALAQGDYGYQIGLDGRDAISQLAQNFDRMSEAVRARAGSLQASQERLRESEARFRSLFEDSPLPLWEKDFSGMRLCLQAMRIPTTELTTCLQQNPEMIGACLGWMKVLNVNQAVLDLFEADSAEQLYENVNAIFTENSLQQFTHALTALQEGKFIYQFESEYQTLRGKKIYVALRWMVSPACREHFERVIVAMMDVTERNQSAELMRQYNQRLEEQIEQRTRDLRLREAELYRAKEVADAASRAKSRFLANMSHELRTPLNAVMGYAQILRRSGNLSSDQQQGVQVIYRSSEHLLHLINDVLDLSKIEAGRLEVVDQSFDLPSLIDTVQEMIQVHAQQKGLQFHCYLGRFEAEPPSLQGFIADPAALPVLVHGDPKRLRQVLLNLLSNAVKFTRQGQVILAVGEYLGSIAFVAQDSGIGIAGTQLREIFLPFHQLLTPAISEGSGLGLSISQRLVEMMGGHLQVQSVVGSGSVFWFSLELSAATSARPLDPLPLAQAAQVKGYQGQRRTLLIVEDTLDSREMLARFFQMLGFEIMLAEDGQQALELLETRLPDAILSDMLMPVMDGFALARHIRSQPHLQHLPLIGMSASVYEADRAHTLAAGCDEFVSKPIQEGKLLRALQNLLALEWEYNPLAAPPAPAALEHGPSPSQAEILQGLLLQGDLHGAVAAIQAWAAQAPELEAFARAVAELASNYQIAALEQLISRYRGGEGAASDS